jgi:hypothetical protein
MQNICAYSENNMIVEIKKNASLKIYKNVAIYFSLLPPFGQI